jgi:hypothetical protein
METRWTKHLTTGDQLSALFPSSRNLTKNSNSLHMAGDRSAKQEERSFTIQNRRNYDTEIAFSFKC